MPNPSLDHSTLQYLNERSIEVLANTGITPSDLRVANGETLVQLQAQLLMGSDWGVWRVAPELIAARPVKEAQLHYRLDQALPPGFDCSSSEATRVWCELLRVAISCRLWPGATNRRLAYSTVHTVLRNLGIVCRILVLSPSEGFWSRLSKAQFQTHLGSRGNGYCDLLRRFYQMGSLPDCPTSNPRTSGAGPLRDRTGEPEHTSQIESDKTFQPFSDEFVAAAGWRVLQVVSLIGPRVIEAVEHACAIPVAAQSSAEAIRKNISPTVAFESRARARDPVIRDWDWDWIDDTGRSIRSLEFSIVPDGRLRGFMWPPKTFAHAWSLLSLIQACCMWTVALASAGRHGELLSMRTDCLARMESGYPTGLLRSTKFDGIGGRQHEVPLPAAVRDSIALQVRLSALAKSVRDTEGKHLWVRLDHSFCGLPLTGFDRVLRGLVRSFGLEDLLGEQSAHMHRFRKTLVRMVALALVHAPKILMDVLGHRDEQMTVLRYILSDPGILADVQETVRELVILKGLEAVENRNTVEGGAASKLRERVTAYAKRIGASAMEPQNLIEFVRAMTDNGSGWAIIAPGIVCTGFTRGGLCNKGQGGANPDYCHPRCDQQLVMPDYLTADSKVASAVSQSLATANFVLEKLYEAESLGEEMLVSQFVGQIRSLLGRWKKVDDVLSAHPLVRKYVSEPLSDVTA